MAVNINETSMLVLKWAGQQQLSVALTERNKSVYGHFFPAIDSGCLRGWLPVKTIYRYTPNNFGNRLN